MTKNRFFTGKGKQPDQNDKAYLSRQMTTDFANRIPIEILRSGTLASKFPRLYCIMDESIFQSFSKKRLNCWLNLPILSAATFFRRCSFNSLKYEKCLYRSINAYFCFRLNTCRSRSPFKLLFRLFPDFSFDARYNSVRALILLFYHSDPTCLTGQNIEEGFPLKTLPSFRPA